MISPDAATPQSHNPLVTAILAALPVDQQRDALAQLREKFPDIPPTAPPRPDDDPPDLAESPIEDDDERADYDADRSRTRRYWNDADVVLLAQTLELEPGDRRTVAAAHWLNWLEYHDDYRNDDQPEVVWLARCGYCSSGTFREMRDLVCKTLRWVRIEYRDRLNRYVIDLPKVKLAREQFWKEKKLQRMAAAESYLLDEFSNKGLDVENQRRLTKTLQDTLQGRQTTSKINEDDVENRPLSKPKEKTLDIKQTPPPAADVVGMREGGKGDERNENPEPNDSANAMDGSTHAIATDYQGDVSQPAPDKPLSEFERGARVICRFVQDERPLMRPVPMPDEGKQLSACEDDDERARVLKAILWTRAKTLCEQYRVTRAMADDLCQQARDAQATRWNYFATAVRNVAQRVDAQQRERNPQQTPIGAHASHATTNDDFERCRAISSEPKRITDAGEAACDGLRHILHYLPGKKA